VSTSYNLALAFYRPPNNGEFPCNRPELVTISCAVAQMRISSSARRWTSVKVRIFVEAIGILLFQTPPPDVRLGGFDGDVDVRITGHVWTSSKSSWYQSEDTVPQFPARYVARPVGH